MNTAQDQGRKKYTILLDVLCTGNNKLNSEVIYFIFITIITFFNFIKNYYKNKKKQELKNNAKYSEIVASS